MKNRKTARPFSFGKRPSIRMIFACVLLAMLLTACNGGNRISSSADQVGDAEKAKAEIQIEARPEILPATVANQGEVSADSVQAYHPPEAKREMMPSVAVNSAAAPMALGMVEGGARLSKRMFAQQSMQGVMTPPPMGGESILLPSQPLEMNTESYNALKENRFLSAANDPLSTFSIDVDTASYANVRRFINDGMLPPPGAVRVEEMINYFSYDYPVPTSKPFSLTTEIGPAPWKPEHKLVRIGLRAKDIDHDKLAPSNLVFLIDVSGSMRAPNKLPLLKSSLQLLVDQLNERDRVGIVVYAGSERVVLEPTAGKEENKEKIRKAIDALNSGGSTHGSQGIVAAYEMAEKYKMVGGNNRVILASDGDFNVGLSSRDQLEKLIEEKRRSGIYLTVLGFGMGNYHDDTMEVLADAGNGNYAYIDNLLEAKKVLVKEMSSTLFTLAKDVKIQVEFNPAKVAAYKLIGYENRLLADEDFQDDTKDAGEVGVGHRVTALYEIIPTGAGNAPEVALLKYQQRSDSGNFNDELLTVKLRYKPEGQESSVLMEQPVKDSGAGSAGSTGSAGSAGSVGDAAAALAATSDDFRFAAAVAGFGMELKESKDIGSFSYSDLLELARNGKGADREGYRAEFIRLLEMAELLKVERSGSK